MGPGDVVLDQNPMPPLRIAFRRENGFSTSAIIAQLCWAIAWNGWPADGALAWRTATSSFRRPEGR